MLKDKFYYITTLNHQDSTIISSVQFNNEHGIFAGHFPGQPVVPGACMLQIVKEILAEVLGISHQLKKAVNLKFIAPVDPRMATEVVIKISYKNIETGIQVNAQLNVNGVTCFKMQGCWAA